MVHFVNFPANFLASTATTMLVLNDCVPLALMLCYSKHCRNTKEITGINESLPLMCSHNFSLAPSCLLTIFQFPAFFII